MYDGAPETPMTLDLVETAGGDTVLTRHEVVTEAFSDPWRVYAVDFRNDVAGSLLKALLFGWIVGLVATYRGYTSAPTSEGVSSATTSTVVISSVSVLIADYIFTALWGV